MSSNKNVLMPQLTGLSERLPVIVSHKSEWPVLCHTALLLFLCTMGFLSSYLHLGTICTFIYTEQLRL